MKKLAYISPEIWVTLIDTKIHVLAGSPTGTDVEGLDVEEEDAPEDMEGRSRRRRNQWDDEQDEQDEKW